MMGEPPMTATTTAPGPADRADPTDTPAPPPTPPRRRAVRIILRTAAVLVVLLLAGGVIGYFALNAWLRKTVAQQTTRSLNLRTTVDAATLTPFGGRLRLDNYRIASPDGFSAEPLLDLPAGEMDVGYADLRRSPVHIRSVTFTRPRLLVEMVNGELNITCMVHRMPPPPEHPIRLVIDDVRVEDATVVLRPAIEGMPAEMTIRVPTFTLHNLGAGGGAGGPGEGHGEASGAPAGATIRQVVTQLVTALAANASDDPGLPPELRELLRNPLKAILDELGAEARQQILRAVPGQMGRTLAGLLEPGATKDPGTLFGRLMGLRATTGPAAGPTSQPSSPGRLLGSFLGQPGTKRPAKSGE
jgi:hypothetical protein